MLSKKNSFTGLWKFISLVIIAMMVVALIAPIPTQTAYAWDAPQPLYPENYANTTSVTDPPLGIPSFSWTEIEGATKYRLQADNDIGFSAPIVVDVQTSNLSYTPAAVGHLFADGEWFWRVRVEQPSPIGVWSDVMTFTKTWVTAENKPTPLEPSNGATLAFFDAPVFSWTPVMGAAKYRFEIATSPDGFGSPALSSDTLATSTQPYSRLANGQYWWRVLPMDRADHLGTASDVRSFTMAYGSLAMNLVPALLAPADEAFPTFTPTFHWTAVEGAEHYRLEYTSEENCDFSVGTSLDTRQTSYTPIDTFPNDQRYCWHVRVESGYGVGEWSETWHFQKRWYLQPQLLTPTNGYQTGLYPVYSWTPVPGAARYRIDISKYAGFSPMFESITTANTTYTPQTKYDGNAHYYWRVTPIDGGGELGLTSSVWGFESISNSTTPIQVYPLYYYKPNDPTFYGENVMNPVEDRTVAYPIFIWHRVMTPAPVGGDYAQAYRIQVDTDPYFTVGHVVWQHDTENTIATPTDGNDFIPTVNQDYFWRVCVLDHIGGSCITGATAGWSQIWKTRFDASLALQPTTGGTPTLLRPAHGQESVEATPLLEWWPLQDATQYQVEVSRDYDFITDEISETVNIPAFAPSTSLAQRILDRTDYGTFYWRVRGYTGSSWSSWSTAWRFQVASQSEWRDVRTLGNIDNRLLIAEDPAGDVISPTKDLTTLFASQSSTNWYLGFTTTMTTTGKTYVFYLDLDHKDGLGGLIPPERSYNLTTVPGHQPEYVIYVDDTGSGINANETWIYTWNGSAWSYGSQLGEIGGAVYTSIYTPTQYIELRVPNEAIGMSQVTSSASVILVGVDNASNTVEDSVPSDPNVPGMGLLSRFSAVSERVNLVAPPSTVSGDPSTIPSVLPFYWDWPTGSNSSSPFAGANLEVHLDPLYTNEVAEFHLYSNISHFAENRYTLLKDIVGDNIYYWRVQMRYLAASGAYVGAWTGGWSFRRLGFTAQNLQTSVTWATPTFSWDKVEGATDYRIQVSTDPYFGVMVVNQLTPMNSYTPPTTLAQGIYYWRVQVNRYANITNDWSDVVQFTLSLPTATGLTPNGDEVQYAPTMCWDPIIKMSEEAPYEPILTAWKYRVLVSQEENFSIIYDQVDTYNNCWTPVEGYEDGTFYWKVAMIDGNNRLGSYSSAATFTKQYPITTLISPISGSVPTTPTFIWTPVDGAGMYRFEVSLYSTYSPLYDSIETVNTQFTPTKVFAEGTIFYWRVAIIDRFGNQGPFTDATIIIDEPITGLTATNDSPTWLGNPTVLTAHVESGTNITYTWDYGDGDQGVGQVSSHIYPDLGNYTATVTATNTINSVIATTVVTIVDAPITGLTATNDSPSELGSLTTLTATISTGTNVSYTWDFGDGENGIGAVVSHTYLSPGTYTATVTASNSTNTTSAETIVDILDVPISGLSAQNDSPTYLDDPTLLTATVVTGTRVVYTWDFGDGSYGSGASTSHIYSDLGNYTATVTATNERNSETATTQVVIIEEPITGLTATNDSPTYLGSTTHLNAQILTGSSVSYSWDFGDGSTGSGAAPSHIYPDLGTYTAIVTATNSLGFASANTEVNIVDAPISGLTASNDSPTEIGSMTTLVATIAGGTHVSYEWDFGDGTSGSGATEMHIYPAVGTYTAIVTATNGTNSAHASTIVTITDVPISGLTAENDSPTYLGDTTTLTASILNGTGVSYSWNYGDGMNGTGRIVTHKYTATGVYTAVVTATNSLGDVSANTTVTIIPPISEYYYVFLPITVK